MRAIAPFVCIATILSAAPAAQAATASEPHANIFSVIGSIEGGPQIGAISGNTLYGTLAYSGDGVLFSYTLSGTYTVLHNFSSSTDGSQPNARLALDGSGNLFGTAPSGGTFGSGTIWEYSAAGVMSSPHAFGNDGDGAVPMQGPTLGPNGVLYGTTGEGAIGGSGNIWSLTSDTYNVLYEFMSGADGHCPFSGITVGADGTMYGTTVGVGFGGNPTGSVWKYTTAGVLTTLYVFGDGNDGEWPDQAPVVDAQGNLYGTTSIKGGSDFDGAIWKIARNGHFSILHQMNGATDGSVPNSPLVIGEHGLLYGTAANGGPGGYGTVFSVSRAGAFTMIHGFTGGSDGGQPTGNLVVGGHGIVYGGTAYGPVFAVKP